VGLGALSGAANPLVQAGRIAGTDAYLGAYMHGKALLDYNKPFVAEDFSKDVIASVVFGLPFAGAPIYAATARSAMKVAGPVLKGAGGSALDIANNLMSIKAITSPLGSMGAKTWARNSAVGRLWSRVSKGRAKVGATDEVLNAERQMAKEGAEIGNLTPEKFARATPSQRRAMMEQLDNYSGQANKLDEINYDGLVENANNMRKETERLRDVALKIDKQAGTPGVWTQQFDVAKQSDYFAKADALHSRIVEAGFGDMAVQLGVLKHSIDPGETLGGWLQARLTASLKTGEHAGASQVEQGIREFTEDASLWGPKLAARAKRVNDAVDSVALARQELAAMPLPKNLEELDAVNHAAVETLQETTAQMRKGYATLYEEGMLTPAQKKAFETATTKTEEIFRKGAEAYRDAQRINDARASAAKLHSEKYKGVREGRTQTPGDMKTGLAERMGEHAGKLQAFKEFAERALTSGTAAVRTASISMTMKELSDDDRREIYLQMQEALPSLTGNPLLFDDQMAKAIGPIMETDSEIGTLATQQAAGTIYYLAGIMPRANNTLYGRTLPPPRAKVNAFVESFVAVLDPLSVAYAAMEGRVTKQMVDAVRNTNPAMYAEIGAALSEVLDKADVRTAPRQTMAGINQFMGGFDTLYSGEALMALQSKYSQTEAQDQAINGGQGAARPMPAHTNPQKGDNDFTFTQRITSY
jgi:hypothetical protein